MRGDVYPHAALKALLITAAIVGVVGTGLLWWQLWYFIDPPLKAPIGWSITLKSGGVETTIDQPEWSYNGWLCWQPRQGEQVCVPVEEVVKITGPSPRRAP